MREVDRIKRLSMEILGKHKSEFGTDFVKNKQKLENISIIRSKSLKNELAGYITKFIKREIQQREEKEEQEAKFTESKEAPAEPSEGKPAEETKTPAEAPSPEEKPQEQ